MAAILGPILSSVLPSLIQLLFSGNKNQDYTKGTMQGYDYTQDPLYNLASQTAQQSPYLQQFNPSMYDQLFQQGVANPVLQQYEKDLLPRINQAYTMPGMSSRGSGFQNALSQSLTDLGTNLGSLRANYLMGQQQQHMMGQQNALSNLLGLSQARAQQVTPYLQQPQRGAGGDFLESILSGLGKSAIGNLDFSKFFNQPQTMAQPQKPPSAGTDMRMDQRLQQGGF